VRPVPGAVVRASGVAVTSRVVLDVTDNVSSGGARS
jgi:hypothetical protein